MSTSNPSTNSTDSNVGISIIDRLIGPPVPKSIDSKPYVPFKVNYSFEHRRKEYEKIVSKFPTKIPVIVEKADKSSIQDIDRHKFLIPNDTSMGHFMCVIRKRVSLKSDEALFVFVNNVIPPMNSLMGEIYKENSDKDGFLYITYSGENAFG